MKRERSAAIAALSRSANDSKMVSSLSSSPRKRHGAAAMRARRVSPLPAMLLLAPPLPAPRLCCSLTGNALGVSEHMRCGFMKGQWSLERLISGSSHAHECNTITSGPSAWLAKFAASAASELKTEWKSSGCSRRAGPGSEAMCFTMSG